MVENAGQTWDRGSRSLRLSCDSHKQHHQSDEQKIDSDYLNFSRNQVVALSKPFLPAAV
jgi:hypothetical protein